MAERNTPIRVLIVDDEPEIRDAYRQILCDTEANLEMTGFHELRSRLFRKNPTEALRHAATRATSFDTVFCQQAAEAVEAVKEALARNEPFAVVFLDMRMPPGRDGVWAATQIRELDPAVEIVNEADRCHLHLRCIDDGVGIAAENLERVFEKGFTTKSPETNHGIGLHWCANAIGALGGQIWAASDGPGRGAALHLLVPLTARDIALAGAT